MIILDLFDLNMLVLTRVDRFPLVLKEAFEFGNLFIFVYYLEQFVYISFKPVCLLSHQIVLNLD